VKGAAIRLKIISRFITAEKMIALDAPVFKPAKFK